MRDMKKNINTPAMDYLPSFRVNKSNDLVLRTSPEAEAFRRKQRAVRSQHPKNPAETMHDAMNRVLAAGGDSTDTKLVLSRHEVQFGVYRGQTFHWLLSKATGYVIKILAAHHHKRESRGHDTSSLMQNKDALSRYAMLFPRVTYAVQQRRVSDSAYDEGALDCTPVGFGELAGLSYQEFYESADPQVQSYKMWLRRARMQSTGSTIDRLKRYVLGRDHKAASSPSAPPTLTVFSSSSSSSPSSPVAPSSFSRSSRVKRSRGLKGAWSSSSVDQHCVITDSSSEDDMKPTAAELELYFSSATDELALPASPASSASPAPASPAPSAPPSPAAGCLPANVPLPESWRSTLPRVQHEWVSRALFTRDQSGKPALNTELQTWYYPPGLRQLYHQPPVSLDDFFQRPFFLWVPRRMWQCTISCPVCAHKMTECGLYKTVRKVLDMDGWYFMGTENLECRGCGKKLASWSRSIMAQLDEQYRSMFPAVLTYRLSCDKRVLMRMRGRSLGHVAHSLRSDLVDHHTKAWKNSCIGFMSLYKKFMTPGVTCSPPPALPEMDLVPTAQCILSAFITDSFTRLEEMRAKVTSVFGSILKMDSTNKIYRKLAGHAAGTAQWVTNVGNEHGQVLMSVLTTAEGYGLQQMTSGLVGRYQQAGKEPPLVLYVDRDCCSTTGGSAAAALFPEWTQLVVRLDTWHFMRRLAAMVTTDSHPFYGDFMRRLSASIFVWNQEDVDLLKRAMEAEEPGAWSRVSHKEMARHCRRRTRGAQEMERLIEETLDHFKLTRYGVAFLLRNQEKVDDIWTTQRRHLKCLQDPPGLELYTSTGQVTRGGVSLPLYRCSRGTTSLEWFHLHLHRFIPGASASATNFQLYLLEGLTRWNEERGRASVERPDSQRLRSFSSQYLDAVNQLSLSLYGKRLVDGYTRTREYTGELIGVNYLFSQTGQELEELPDDPDVPKEEEEEEDFRDQVEEFDEGFHEFMFDTDFLSDTSQPGKSELADLQECVDHNGTPGYQHVLNLAECLVALRGPGRVTVECEAQILALWEKLPEGDKFHVNYPPGYREHLTQGRFIEAVRLDSIGRPCMKPDASRLMEAICILLCRLHSQSHSFLGAHISRWTLIYRNYRIIRDSVLGNPTLRDKLLLFDIPQKMLIQWYNSRKETQESYVLQADAPSTSNPLVAPDPMPLDREGPQSPAPDQPLPGVSHQTGPSQAPDLPAAAGPTTEAEPAVDNAAPAPGLPSWPPPPFSPKTLKKKQLEKKRQDGEGQGLFSCVCKLCHQPKTRHFGHSRFFSKKSKTMFHFCQSTMGRGVEDWLEEKRMEEWER